MVTGQGVGLTVRDMSDMGRLAQLAANPQGTTREEIFLAVASLYRVQGNHLNPRERELMRDILRMLAGDVEMAIRIALAERLADDADAPHDLIVLLADDRIEVARPLILRSPLLTEEDVLRMIAEAGEDHHEAIAGRPDIGEPVTEALSRSPSVSVLTALVRNVTARISPHVFDALAEKSRRIAELQAPLAQRPDLPQPTAMKMCAFVSDALKSHILRHYAVEAAALGEALAKAEQSVAVPPDPARAEPAGSAQRLIDKLALSGQLKAGFLLRVLNQGQIDLFDLAFARLLDLPLAEQRRKFYEAGPRAVALACRAVGIDRCVFATVHDLSRRARNMRQSLAAAELAEVQAVFETFTKAAARNEFRAI
jgi:uncharacterized protein (DUF2336 family)